jgi:hypothetical protein
MRPWRHQQTLPPPQRNWAPTAGRPPADYTQRMEEPTISAAGQETLSQVGVRIIRTGHYIKGRGELMSMRIGKMVNGVMIERVEEVQMEMRM